MVKYLILVGMLTTLLIKSPSWINTCTIILCAILGVCLLQDLVIKPLWRKRQRRLTAEANAEAIHKYKE